MAHNEPPTAAAGKRGTAVIDRLDGRTVLVLKGEHDSDTSSELAGVLDSAMASEDFEIVVDLSGVEFMDAATVGVLMHAHETLAGQGRSLVLESPSPRAHNVLDLCGLAHLVAPGTDRERAASGPHQALASWVEIPPTKPSDGGGP